MPMYEHRCRKCAKQVSILRSFDAFQEAPTADETAPCDIVDEGGSGEHDWEKVIGAPQIIRGPSWNG